MVTGLNMAIGQLALLTADNLALNTASRHVQIRLHNMVAKTVRERCPGRRKTAAQLSAKVIKVFIGVFKYILTQGENKVSSTVSMIKFY